jgi:hypothetical protein
MQSLASSVSAAVVGIVLPLGAGMGLVGPRRRPIVASAPKSKNPAYAAGAPKPRIIARIERRYEAIVVEASPSIWLSRRFSAPNAAAASRDASAIISSCASSNAVLRFPSEPDVPFTNNQAKRDAPMMKLRQKSPADIARKQRRGFRRHPIRGGEEDSNVFGALHRTIDDSHGGTLAVPDRLDQEAE